MSEEEIKVPDALFKDVKFYVVGDIETKVVQLLKAGKGKEVSYNALATHIIAEDGDNPEVSESREVFDLPVVKPSWVILSVRCGDLLPVTGFSPESGQIFFGVTACLPRLPDDLNALWAFLTFYGGECQLNLNKKVTHLVVKEPKGAKFECALKHPGIKIVTPDWITDSVKDKNRKDESLYHPRLTYVESEEESEAESYDARCHSNGSYSPQHSQPSSGGSSGEESSPRRRPGPKRLNSVSPTSPRKPELRSERMFDDSDDDSSPEKEGTNLNWTSAEVVTPTVAGIARQRVGPAVVKDPGSSAGSGLINLCATAAPVPGSGGPLAAEARVAQQGVSGPEGWNPTMRTLRNITNNSDMQPTNRPAVAHVNKSKYDMQHPIVWPQPGIPSKNILSRHPIGILDWIRLSSPCIRAKKLTNICLNQGRFIVHEQCLIICSLKLQALKLYGSSLKSSLSFVIFPLNYFVKTWDRIWTKFKYIYKILIFPKTTGHWRLNESKIFLRRNFLQIIQNLTANQTKPVEQTNQSHVQILNSNNPPQFSQSKLPRLPLTATPLPPQLQQQQQPHISQLFGHEQGQDIPQDGFLLGCVFAIADYPEQMADKQLLATWKRVIQACGGVVDPTLTSRCTHLLCESQVSNMYVQALREGKRCVTAHWLSTVLKKKKMVPPHRTLHLPFAFPPGAKPCSQHILSVTGFMDADRDDLKLMAYLAGARYTGYLCRGNTVLICKEPGGMKYEKAKEWKIPCVNAQWLCDILLGNFEALRQIQHSRYSVYTQPEPLMPNPQLVQNLLAAWRTPVKVTTEALVNLQLLQKQKISDSTNPPSNKKARLEEIQSPNRKLPPESTPRVMLTGFEPLQVQQYTKRLHALGGEVAESSQKATHLLASKVTRTVKFLSAMSVIKHIVTPEWLEESWRSQKFVGESMLCCSVLLVCLFFCSSLEESLKRAHAAPLFKKGKYFYLTPGICPSLSTMKAILESAGGKLLVKQPSYRKIMEHKQNKNLPEIILISCDNDLHLCREYFMKNIDVHNAEFILTGVLTQKLDYESYPFPVTAAAYIRAF
uniref:PAX-interacting protein 1 n=1 Tax=Poecilia formosa TaxID=48698 RepID=A0A096MF41_POEFO